MKSDKKMPLVSIGLPVYNGSAAIRRCLDSLLVQDYPNFELIISDDGSKDDTPRICREYAEKDNRIIFHQMEKNVGEVTNHNFVFNISRGKYFTWVSQDDFRLPGFISKCVERLEENENAVLCHSRTAAFLDDPGNVFAIITHDTMDGITSPAQRFITAIKSLPATAIESVFRSDMLRTKTNLFEGYISSDIVLTRELALYGEYLQVPEVLSWRSMQYMRPSPQKDYSRLTGKKTMPWYTLPFMIVLYKHARSIWRSRLSIFLKIFMLGALFAHETKMTSIKMTFRLSTGLLGAKCPNRMIRYFVSATLNPNFRPVRDLNELPPQLQPGWCLLNHRNLKQAEYRQAQITAKILSEGIIPSGAPTGYKDLISPGQISGENNNRQGGRSAAVQDM